ncbi:MAG: type II secretion system GspH family protein, partial [Phycisphaerales bacterium]|nr:type II secretion system GspH family protein [Phycisphaerales bacterium]
MIDDSIANPARCNARVKRSQAPRASGRRGFTLVELVATMVVLGTLATIAGGIVQRLAQVQTTAAIRAQLYADANLAMERIVMMIKHTPPRAGVSQTPALLYLDADDIVWENNDELDFIAASGGNPGRLMLRSVRDGDPSAG